MDYKFILGTALGMIGGALIVCNSVKAKSMVKNGQEMVEKEITKITEKKKGKKQK